jgi:hypothetical protein
MKDHGEALLDKTLLLTTVSTHSGITNIIPHCVADCPPMDASKASRLREDESVISVKCQGIRECVITIVVKQ